MNDTISVLNTGNTIFQAAKTLLALIFSLMKLVNWFNTRLKIQVSVKQHDYAKGANASIHPVNSLEIRCSNPTSGDRTTRFVEFIYVNKDSLTKETYDWLSYNDRKEMRGATLPASKEICISLSMNKWDQKQVLDNLEDVVITDSCGRKYKVGKRKLHNALQELRKFPPPDHRNLDIHFKSAQKRCTSFI